jgi:hypothetical protein
VLALVNGFASGLSGRVSGWWERVPAEVAGLVHRRREARRREPDRGDVPGWVLVTLMTAGLVLTLWAVAGPRLADVFNEAMDRVISGP